MQASCWLSPAMSSEAGTITHACMHECMRVQALWCKQHRQVTARSLLGALAPLLLLQLGRRGVGCLGCQRGAGGAVCEEHSAAWWLVIGVACRERMHAVHAVQAVSRMHAASAHETLACPLTVKERRPLLLLPPACRRLHLPRAVAAREGNLLRPLLLLLLLPHAAPSAIGVLAVRWMQLAVPW